MLSFVPLPVQLFYRVPRPRLLLIYVGTYFSKAIWKIIFNLILVQYMQEQQGTYLDIHRTYSYILLFYKGRFRVCLQVISRPIFILFFGIVFLRPRILFP
jgi:hypothetical protein